MLTTSCILSNSQYPADATAETGVTTIALPKGDFDRLMHDSDEFCSFVLSSFDNRLTGLITLVEQVAMGSIEQRLATFLLQRTDVDHQILEATDQYIATEIGTTRTKAINGRTPGRHDWFYFLKHSPIAVGN